MVSLMEHSSGSCTAARQRERERGYNQSVEIVRGISAETGLPVLDKVLERVSFTVVRRKKGVGTK